MKKNVIFSLLFVLITFISSNGFICGMNDTSDTSTQTYFKSKISELTIRLDANFKAMRDFVWRDASKLAETKIAIWNDLESLAVMMGKDYLDWNAELVSNVCVEICIQLAFDEKTKKFDQDNQIVTAWHMKNCLFSLFDQARVTKDGFKDFNQLIEEDLKIFEGPCYDVHDTRSHDQLVKEYECYKEKLSGISRFDKIFTSTDKKLTVFKEDRFDLLHELEAVETYDSPHTLNGWGSLVMSQYVLPVISYGFFTVSDGFKEKQRNKIIESDRKIKIKDLQSQLVELEADIKKELLQALAMLKNETIACAPCILDHKQFLKSFFALADKECKTMKLSDYIDDYNVLKNINKKINIYGLNLIESAQNILVSTKKKTLDIDGNIDAAVDTIVNTIGIVGLIENLENKLGSQYFDMVIGVLERVVVSENFRSALCSFGKTFFSDDRIGKIVCNIHSAKIILSEKVGLSLVDAKQVIDLIGNDRLGVLLKIVLKMASKKPDIFKKNVDNALHSLVNTFLKSIEKGTITLEDMKSGLFRRVLTQLTQQDRVVLLSYCAQVNKKAMPYKLPLALQKDIQNWKKEKFDELKKQRQLKKELEEKKCARLKQEAALLLMRRKNQQQLAFDLGAPCMFG